MGNRQDGFHTHGLNHAENMTDRARRLMGEKNSMPTMTDDIISTSYIHTGLMTDWIFRLHGPTSPDDEVSFRPLPFMEEG